MPLDAKKLFDTLDREGVKCVIIGGMAAIAHGSASATFDLDLCYARDDMNLEHLERALAPLHPRLRDVPANVAFVLDARTLRNGLNFTLSTDAGDLDLMGEVAGIGSYEQAVANSETIIIYSRPRSVLTLEALIRAKRVAGRSRDLQALPELEALLELRKRGEGKV